MKGPVCLNDLDGNVLIRIHDKKRNCLHDLFNIFRHAYIYAYGLSVKIDG